MRGWQEVVREVRDRSVGVTDVEERKGIAEIKGEREEVETNKKDR